MKHTLLLLLLLCSFACFSYTQQSVYDFDIKHWNSADGLSSNSVRAISQDQQGYLWIGTLYGLNRFDGHHFRSFKSFPGDLSRLKNDRIDQIVEDFGTNLWIKAYDNQIYRFDKVKEQFNLFSLKHDKKVLFNRIKVCSGGEIFLITKDDG